ncbi:hypothetical protein D9M68_766020 [compost metagenome]
MQQGDGVEDPLDDPEFADLQQVQARRHPQLALVAVGLLEVSLAVESRRPIDQPFPVAALRHGEAHRGTAGACLAVPEILLGVPALDQAQVEAAVEAQVGVDRRGGLLLCGRSPIAPVLEQIGEQILDVKLRAAFAASAGHHPGVERVGVQGLLLALAAPAVRAGAFAQPFGLGDRLELELELQLVDHLAADGRLHGLHAPTPCSASRRLSSRAERLMPAIWGWSCSTRWPRRPSGTWR